MPQLDTEVNVKHPIQSKVLFFFLVLIILSLAINLFFSLDLFYQDKTAYIFEANLNKNEQISQSIKNFVNTSLEEGKNLRLQLSVLDQKDKEAFFTRKPHFQSLEVYTHSTNDGWTLHTQVIRPGLEIDKNVHTSQSALKEVLSKNLKIDYHLTAEPVPYIEFYQLQKESNEIFKIRVAATPIMQQFKSPSFKSFLMDPGGHYLLAQAPEFATKELSGFVVAQSISEGVFDLKLSNGRFLVGYSKLQDLGINVVTLIDKDKAFMITRFLIEKSLAIAVLVISVAIAFGVLFSRSLTRPIDKLMEATRKIADGDFQSEITVQSNDELAVLGSSFNYMSGEIRRYMEEVKEKTRMEGELAVAQIVQSSFFPNNNVSYGDFSLSGYYQSASECGGDWWGTFEIQGRIFVLIGDATGHGVPAALLTATANCCAQLIGELATERPQLLDDPAKILKIMNEVIFKLGGRILMTFFIGVYDKKAQSLVYSNASHNSPLIYRHSENEPSKSDIEVLGDAVGLRLGHKQDPEYVNARVPFKTNDVIVLFSDGITEAENDLGKQYGERRFMKSMLKVAKSSPDKILEQILSDATEFCAGVKPNDDVTLIVAKQG